MLKCPVCEDSLSVRSEDGWQCACGEMIPFGLEIDSEESCATCPVTNCPRRK
ncbi:MAG: hypothetical protein OHK006_00080 [Thermodesulfovibrionales bacterium]